MLLVQGAAVQIGQAAEAVLEEEQAEGEGEPLASAETIAWRTTRQGSSNLRV